MYRKSNLRHALSLMLSILLSDVISIIVFFSLAGVLNNTFGFILIQVINLLLLVGLIYLPLWTVGEKDINYVRTGKISYDKYSGLKIGLIAMTVFYLPYVLLIIGKILENQVLVAAFRIITAPFFGFMQLMLPVEVQNIMWWHILFTLVLPLIVPAITSTAYYFGYRRISLTGKLVYKKKK